MNDERPFLNAILARPDDEATKLVYADWLDEQGDPRGEYLRLMVKVREERGVTPEQRQRHKELSAELAELLTQERQAWQAFPVDRRPPPENRERQRRINELEGELQSLSKQLRQQIPSRLKELAGTFDSNWLAVVSDPEIEGCGKGVGSWRLRFDFVCDKTWAEMQPTASSNVRHCETCSQSVHFCDNLADAREHSMEGHCIAVDLGVIRRDGDLVPGVMFAGQPSKADVRKTYEADLDSVSQARLDGRKQRSKKRTRVS